MLLSVHVKNLALIDEVEMNFEDHLNILTGETGAGKSVLMGAVNMALGSKVSKDMIRHGADYALADYEHVLNLFIYGDMNKRIERVKEKYSVSEKDAKDMIIKKDKQRASYYNYYSSKRWGDSKSYDLCINSSKVGVDGAIKIIKEFAEAKMAYTNK